MELTLAMQILLVRGENCGWLCGMGVSGNIEETKLYGRFNMYSISNGPNANFITFLGCRKRLLFQDYIICKSVIRIVYAEVHELHNINFKYIYLKSAIFINIYINNRICFLFLPKKVYLLLKIFVCSGMQSRVYPNVHCII